VRAHVHTINGFSAHADQAELIAWHRHTGAARTVLTHGEAATMQQFAAKLSGTKVEMPALGDSFDL
jgi:metallo-beta-lactamase family protein